MLLTVTVTPESDWPCPLPRLGLLLGLDSGLDRATWYGGGPGEAYRSDRPGARHRRRRHHRARAVQRRGQRRRGRGHPPAGGGVGR
ncbi:hypothetical protein [Streptomyces sp. B6B3]|uniref:hypothetical protein n=1 Tax=Streptomyces sp. B6B3 TaxID=3153570 RepID=UPI00325E1E53